MAAENYPSVNPKTNGANKLFDNPVLEKLTHVYAPVPITMYIIIAIGLLVYGSLYTSLSGLRITVLFLSGLFAFSLLEYLLHRYVFHMSTHTESRKKLQRNIHGLHHEYPKDKERLAMPLPASITLAVILYLIFRLITGENVYALLSGVMIGYSLYLLVHYLIHAYPPPKNFLRELWINHSIHHYKDGNQAFGVSSPLWDYVFGTMPPKKKRD